MLIFLNTNQLFCPYIPNFFYIFIYNQMTCVPRVRSFLRIGHEGVWSTRLFVHSWLNYHYSALKQLQVNGNIALFSSELGQVLARLHCFNCVWGKMKRISRLGRKTWPIKPNMCFVDSFISWDRYSVISVTLYSPLEEIISTIMSV